jgi:hypothetical protein
MQVCENDPALESARKSVEARHPAEAEVDELIGEYLKLSLSREELRRQIKVATHGLKFGRTTRGVDYLAQLERAARWSEAVTKLAVECGADMIVHDEITFNGPNAEKNLAEFTYRLQKLLGKVQPEESLSPQVDALRS